MLPVILSIALLVLLSVVVITVVTGEGETQPTSARGRKVGSERPEPDTPAPAGSRAEGLQRPRPVEPDPPAAVAAASTGVVGPGLARHRLRSSFLLVLYVLVAGVVMATAIGATAAGLAVLLRDAVTS